MRGLAALLAFFLLALVSNSAIANDDDALATNGGPIVSFRGCAYYEHRNFDGAHVDVVEGTNRRYVGDTWNDRISSIACHSDCTLEAFEHREFGGARSVFYPNFAYVGSFWNDRISSLRVSCAARKPVGPAADESIGKGMEQNTDRPGSDYKNLPLWKPLPERCQLACEADSARCQSWTYVRPSVQGQSAACYLKNAKPAPVGNECCISGEINSIRIIGRAERSSTVKGAPCLSGYVWREAGANDAVCVTPESRALSAQENAVAASRRDVRGGYGSASCANGFVWREAFDGDLVCVTPERRAAVAEENRLAPERVQ